MLTKIVAPITPFIAEEIYTKLTDKKSVHLEDFPKYDESLIDEKVEEKMDLVRDICSLGRFAREEAKIKVRQPLNEILVQSFAKDIMSDLTPLVMEELNVKNVNFTEDVNTYVDYQIKPNFREVGKLLGSKIKPFTEILNNLDSKDIEKLKNERIENR